MSLILIAEDNQALRENMKWALVSGYNVIEAETADDCVNQFRLKKPDLVCLDMGLDNEPLKGLDVIDSILTIDRNAKIIVITANTSSQVGPESVRKGAFDFFNKPVDIDQLKIVINRALKRSELEKQLPDADDAKGAVQSDATLSMLGESAVMKQVFEIIKKLSQTDMNVLICGESGTGKELCARAIHYHSVRKTKNFVPINCGAIPENLIESELFGYVRGAFTGANSDKEGLLESANGGTVLLDEIGEMPKNLQVKLLRFLEDQNVQRVGDTVLRKVNVRVIAATNRKNLDNENSELRSDLYYRLSEFQIDLPPLRQRGEDILIIARALVAKNREKFRSAKLQMSPRAESALLNYSWPGNVRELENKLSRASIICQNQTIEPEDLQLASVSSYSNMNFKDARNAFEKEYLTNLLKRFEYNISDAARAAEISRPTLYDMMKKLGLQIHTESHIRQ
jgi:two-component system, NtrC family, response regulator